MRRIALLLTALPLAIVAGAGPASAHDVDVPGCYGGGSGQTTLCDVTVHAGTPYHVETYQTTVPLCAGSCQYVPVTMPWFAPGDGTEVCVSWLDGNGSTGGTCS